MRHNDDVMAEAWTYAVDILPYLREPEEMDDVSVGTSVSENGTDKSICESTIPNNTNLRVSHSVSTLSSYNGGCFDQTDGHFSLMRTQSAYDITAQSRYSRELCRLSRDVENISLQREAMRIGRVLTRGKFSCVCSGSLRSSSPGYPSHTQHVTVHITSEFTEEDDRRNYLLNTATVAKLQHDNIVQVLGVCVDGSPQSPVGVEILTITSRLSRYVTLHNLLLSIRENNPELLSVYNALGFADQICAGAKYLHQQKILHKNLQAKTCLVDSSYTLKLSDIDIRPLSCREPDIRWLPLEVLHHNTFTINGLVWTIGVVIWEILTLGVTPYPHLETSAVTPYVVNGKRLMRPNGCSKDIYAVMYECWAAKPRDRPSLSVLQSNIRSKRSQLPAHPPAQEVFQNMDEYWEDEYL